MFCSNSSDPQSNRTSTGSSIRPNSPPDVHKDGDSDFSETCLLDDVDVSDHLVRKNSEEEGPEIRGGSVDALVVYATTVSKQGMLLMLQVSGFKMMSDMPLQNTLGWNTSSLWLKNLNAIPLGNEDMG